MRAGIRGIATAVAVAGLIVAGCSSGKSPSVVSPSATTGAPTSATSGPSTSSLPVTSGSATSTAPSGSGGAQSVTISPSSGLKSGQTVHVTATGFSPNQPLVINECADKGASTGPGDCNLEGLVQTMSDASGKVTADYKVTTGPFGANKITCSASQPCLLSVSQAVPSPTQEADVRLQFG